MGCGAGKSQKNNVAETTGKPPEKQGANAANSASPATNNPSAPANGTSNTSASQSGGGNSSAEHEHIHSNPALRDMPKEPPKGRLAPLENRPKPVVIEVDIKPTPTNARPGSATKTSVQERLERLAKEKAQEKALPPQERPSTADLQRRMAEAEERRRKAEEERLEKLREEHEKVERSKQLAEAKSEEERRRELQMMEQEFKVGKGTVRSSQEVSSGKK